MASAILFAPFYRNISAGILLGAIFSLMNLNMLESSFKAMMSQDIVNPLPVMMTGLFRLALLAVPMYVSIRWPDKISIIGLAIGFILFLPAIIIDTLRKEEKQ